MKLILIKLSKMEFYPFKKDGIWCKWSNWSQCSVHQGNGIVTRKRFCRHTNSSSYTSCFGQHTEISECYKPDCRINILLL